MIIGEVGPRRHCVVTLAVRGPAGQEETVRFLLDTGFNGALSLPSFAVTALGLVQFDSLISNLADGRRVEVPSYRAVVVWDGEERPVNVIASGTQPLLGTALLLGHRLTIEVVDGGRFSIEAL